ncbi:tyrosine-type recombinase/integrase [Pilimelia anulata]|uniref:tyrosine-type recombinase/integrase n=1 Tax=Pilimelia anulata TaxID=53371 RepID=UPI001E477716|nr:tyrosine-type recombinase/integrase [Pilimelia anulata]
MDELGFASRFVSGGMRPVAAVTQMPPRPLGDLDRVSAADLSDLAGSFGEGLPGTRNQRRAATRQLLDYLATFPGQTWQQRWDASPLGAGQHAAAAPIGARQLFCLRAIRPTLLAFRSQRFVTFNEQFVAAQSDQLLDAFVAHAMAQPIPVTHRRDAISDLCCLLTVQGVALTDVRPPGLLHFAHANRAVLAQMKPGNKAANRFIARGTWNVLHAMGYFPPSTPQTMREAMHRGQQSVTELVDRYPIRSQAVRQLLIDYASRRRADTDYATLTNLILNLVHHFWCKIEALAPGQADLRIDPDVYAAWREQIALRDDGTRRATTDTIVIGVRSFYLDLHTWAAEEPERWAAWVAPSPVSPTDIRGLGARRRRIIERSAGRTRVRQPLLPTLIAHVEARHDRATRLFAEASAAIDGQSFCLDSRPYQRVIPEHDRKHAKAGHLAAVRVMDLTTGSMLNAAFEEEEAFWDWAVVETLRHSGVRIEELCEPSHLSIRQYQRANGEVIALLVITPSKTDRERVIPMSADLFHVIASIIRRHTRDGRTIPLVRRFDPHDKVWSAPLPYLFQRLKGATPAVIAAGTILLRLRRVCAAIATANPAFKDLRITPHDFRRIFATDLVNSGLPIHIGAALLGHLNIQTTRGYVAVFDEDVVRHFQAHLQQRRHTRPDDEYAPVADTEWAEFEEHFDKRKVELGSCARPYGTGCQHEHACIRCPMLNINPKMIDRLNDIEGDLLVRRSRAETENWLGEIEGIDLTLTYLRSKRDQAERQNRRRPVHLGLPQRRPSKT